MSYTMNPHLPHLRMQAANLVIKNGWSARQVARHTGFDHSTVVRWVAKARLSNRRIIPTESCRPHHHPHRLSHDIVLAILNERSKHHRCAEVIHYQLAKEGYEVSLSSVKRTLKRHGLTYPSKWKKWHVYPPRPLVEKPGDLVEIDTIHDGPHEDRLYLYTLLDVCSRWAWAIASPQINGWQSVKFVHLAQGSAPFGFTTLQSDHGSEFAKWFSKQMVATGVAHRHSRVKTPTDNGHLERFNRTIQQECLARAPRSLRAWNKAIPEFIHYYNTERPHMALGMKTPMEVVRSY